MSTKAEQARARAQRTAHPPKPKAPPKRRRTSDVDTSEPGVSATDKKSGDGKSTATRHPSKRAAKKAAAVLEDSAKQRPSRKSTRKTPTGVKSTSNLERRQTRKVTSPEARADRAKAAKAGAKKGKPSIPKKGRATSAKKP